MRPYRMSHLEATLSSTRAYIDQAAAELHDPATSPERLTELHVELRALYDALRGILEETRDP